MEWLHHPSAPCKVGDTEYVNYRDTRCFHSHTVSAVGMQLLCGMVDNTFYLTFLCHRGAGEHRTLVFGYIDNSMPSERAAGHMGGRAGVRLHHSHFPSQMQVLVSMVGGGRVSSTLPGSRYSFFRGEQGFDNYN